MFRYFLLSSCVFLGTVSVFAADITNPFYLPKQNEMGSITSVAFRKTKVKSSSSSLMNVGTPVVIKDVNSNSSYNKITQEELQYGLTNNLSLVMEVGNTAEKTRLKGNYSVDYPEYPGYSYNEDYSESSQKDENMNWKLGLSWNILTGPAKLQISANYGQDKLVYTQKGTYKYASAEIKAGYQFQKFLPYVSVGEELPVAQSKGDDKPEYNAKIGVYQGSCENWGLDTGIRWVHSESEENRGYLAEAEASYYLTPRSALSIYGTYMLDGKAKGDTDLYDKSLGARLRWFFN